MLALLAAWGLRTGRRAAWILAVAVNAAIAALTGGVLGVTELLDAKTRDLLRIEDGIAFVLATLVPVLVVVLLLVTRRRFLVTAPRRATVQFFTTVIGSWIVLAAAYVVIGLVDGENYLDGPAIRRRSAGRHPAPLRARRLPAARAPRRRSPSTVRH